MLSRLFLWFYPRFSASRMVQLFNTFFNPFMVCRVRWSIMLLVSHQFGLYTLQHSGELHIFSSTEMSKIIILCIWKNNNYQHYSAIQCSACICSSFTSHFAFEMVTNMLLAINIWTHICLFFKSAAVFFFFFCRNRRTAWLLIRIEW